VSTAEDAPAAQFCSYETFGVRFFEHAVTAERIVAAMSGVVGSEIEFGPVGAGPGRVARVSATGQVGTPRATRTATDPLVFRLVVPVDLTLVVQLGGQTHRFDADLTVGVALTARAAEPLTIVIDIEPPTAEDVRVTVNAQGLRATLLQYVAGIDDEIRRFVAKYVAREIAKPGVQRARVIDVAARIDAAWGR
jgi:hypothetical protein